MDEEYSWKLSVNYILNVSRPVRTSGLCRWDKACIGCKNRLCGFILVKNNSIRLKIVTTNTRISIFACFTEKRNPARLNHCMSTVTALMILMPYQCDIFYLIFNQIQHLFPLIEVWLLLDTHDIPESGLFFVLNVLMKQNLFRVNRKPWIIYNKNNFLVFLFDELVRITPSSFFIIEFLANLLNWITIFSCLRNMIITTAVSCNIVLCVHCFWSISCNTKKSWLQTKISHYKVNEDRHWKKND